MSGIFTIPAGGMKEGHHVFKFEINKGFFDMFEESEIKEGNLVAVVNAIKTSSHIDLEFSISGEVEVCCDRCLEMYSHPLECTNRLLVKFGHEADDSDPDIITVPRDENELDLKQFVYEFIHLALPIQKVHPADENGASTCDPVMLQKLEEHLIDGEKNTDPRWDELKKLMNDN